MLSLWPWGQINPIIHPIAGIAIASRFSYAMTTLFFGQQVPALHPPLAYLPTWFSLQLPEIYLVAAISGIAGYLLLRAAAVRRLGARLSRFRCPLPHCDCDDPAIDSLRRGASFPVRDSPARRAGGRRDREWTSAACSRIVRILIAGPAIVAAAFTVRDMIVLHPYESLYFNRFIAGGLPGVNGRFETDYWGTSYREALQWVEETFPARVFGSPIAPTLCRPAITFVVQRARGSCPSRKTRIPICYWQRRAGTAI